MTPPVYQSQIHPSHGNLRDGIQDLEYKTSIDGRFCLRLYVYVSGLSKAVQCILHGLGGWKEEGLLTRYVKQRYD